MSEDNGAFCLTGRMPQISYPRMFLQLSEELATIRSEMSKDVYSENSNKHRGDDEHRISSLGILGELIARHYLEDNKVKSCYTPLIDRKPIVEPDITIGDKTYDVKCMRFHNNKFQINAGSHDNLGKRPHKYWFIQPDIYKLIAESFIFDATTVNDWDRVMARHTEIYELPKDRLLMIEDVLQPQSWMK